jgi:sigma-B regulation protein RsbU (phosphoserine phosphatase)
MTEQAPIIEHGGLLRAALDCFEEAIFLLDERGAVTYVNEAATELTGYEASELMGCSLAARLNLVEAMGNRLPVRRKVSLRRGNGHTTQFILAHYRLGLEPAGALVRLRKCEGERRRRPSFGDLEKTLHDIFDTIPDGLILIDEMGAIRFFNLGAEKLFGYRRDEMLGQNVKLLMPPPNRDAHDRYLANYLRTGVKKIIGIGREVEALRKDGVVFPIYLSIGELRLEDRRMFVGVTHDLTNLERVKQELLTLSSAVDQSPTAVLISNKQGVIEYVNTSFLRLTGYDANELIGQNPRLLSSGHTDRVQYQRVWNAILVGEEWRGEIEDRKKDGSLYWAKQTITPLRDGLGEITHYLAIQEDVTALKQEQESLVRSEERFRHVAEMTGEWLWEQDEEGRYTYSSGAVAEILGFAPEEIIGKSYLELQGPGEPGGSTGPSSVPSQFVRPFYRITNAYRHRNGSTVFTESSGAPIFDEQGNVVLWRGVDRDITENKAFEDALRLRNRAMESVHVGVAICDARAAGAPVIYVNPALCRITGYSREELMGRNTRILRGPETDPATLERIGQALALGQDYETTLRSYRKGGAPFWNELFISPVADESGAITHYVEIHTDVTERRRAEESRQQLEIAKHIQLSLLPVAPMRCRGVEVAGLCVPTGQVGGDYFDFFENSATIDVTIADVSGHSVGAALLMTEVRSALRLETRRSTTAKAAPGRVLKDLNDLLYDDLTKAESFITMFYTKYEPSARRLHYANAGHNPPLLLRVSRKESIPLEAEGLVLGALRQTDFEEKSTKLRSGDVLLLYTDGVVEARNTPGEFFGLDRLRAALHAYRALSPEALANRIYANVRAFCGNRSLEDDIAIVVMRAN